MRERTSSLSTESSQPLPTVSVLIPCFDEADTIGEVVSRVLALPEVTQVVVVDDGSRDGDLQESLPSDNRLLLVTHPSNQGKGASIRTALGHANGQIIAIQDADLEYPPEQIPKLLVPILCGEADVVYGTRFAGKLAARPKLANYWANRGLTWLSNWATGLSLSDMETGHKLFTRTALEGLAIKENRFGFEPEITAKLARKGVQIIELPVAYHPRQVASGKKIGFLDGIRALWCIFRYAVWR